MAANELCYLPITEELLEQVVDVHMKAFVGYKSVRMGAGYTRAFLRWFINAEEACAIAAIDDKDVVGYVVGAPLTYASSLTRSILPDAAASFITRPSLWMDAEIIQRVVLRLRSMLYKNAIRIVPEPPLPQPVYSLVSVAVLPKVHGRNIGRELVEAFECSVAQRKGRAVRLSVYTDNKAARRMYEKAGWLPFGLSDSANWCYYYKVLTASK